MSLLGLTAIGGLLAYKPAARQYRIDRAKRALSDEDLTAADRALQKAGEIDPDSAEVAFLKARLHRHRGDLAQIRVYLDKAKSLGMDPEVLRREWLLTLASFGSLQSVESELPQMLMTADEDGPEICNAFVKGYCLNLRFEDAQRLVDVWRADHPGDPGPEVSEGHIRYSRSQWGEAVAAYRAALAKSPTSFPAQLGLARALAKQNAIDEATERFRECLHFRPRDPQILMGLAECLTANAQLEEARSVLQQVVANDPQNLEAWRQLGELEYSAGHADQAIAHLQPLADLWPEDSAICYVLAKALAESGRKEEAAKYFATVERVDQQFERLDELFKMVVARPNDADLRFEIGNILMQHRSREESVVWLQSVLLIDPQYEAAHALLAEYREKRNRHASQQVDSSE